jgi:uncharacterized membrane protein
MLDWQVDLKTYDDIEYVHTLISGMMTLELRDLAAEQTMKVILATGVRRILWDIRDSEVDYSATQDGRPVQADLRALGIGPEDCIAVLFAHNREQHHDDERATHELGFMNVVYFESEEEALHWLTRPL